MKDNPRKDIFNNIAEKWDEMFKFDKMQIDILNQFFEAINIKNDDKILDIGCGTGVLIPYILKYLDISGELTCLDISDKMIDIARSKFFDSNIIFKAEDIYYSTLKENYYTKIIIFSAFPHLHDKIKALSIFHKLLKNNGNLIIIHLNSSNEINNFHKNKVSNPVLQNDYLPSANEMKDIINNKFSFNWKIYHLIDENNKYFINLLKL